MSLTSITVMPGITGDNGSLWFWDWKSGYNFQQSETVVQPGTYILSIPHCLLLFTKSEMKEAKFSFAFLFLQDLSTVKQQSTHYPTM